MKVQDEIHQAIAAHGKWKVKLRNAIDSGECESTPQKVKKDYNCSFGKWLRFRIDDEYKESSYYKEVVALHANFHKEAGTILELALTGNKDEAKEMLKVGGNFASCSARLTKKMIEWQNSL